MKLKRTVILAILITGFIVLDAHQSIAQIGERCPSEVTSAIRQIKDELCPDNRLALYDVWGTQRDSTIILTGETTNKVAHDSCVQRVKRVTQMEVLDKIVVLPQPELGTQTYGIVYLSTANLRRSPSVTSELINQAIMGAVIRLLKKHGGWYFCQFDDGYLGWMNEWSFQTTDSIGIAAWEQRPKLVVSSNFSQVYSNKSIKSNPVSDLVRGAVIACIKKGRKWTEVELPDGRQGFVRSSDMTDYTTVYNKKKVNARDVVRTACQFIGYPYLWGGTSPKGFDCSGFTMTVFGLNGLKLPRDANLQVKLGQPVNIDSSYSQLTTGDLLFFGKNPHRITHVGIYLGNKEFIHSDGMVHIGSFAPDAENYDSYRVKTLQQVRRVL